ncbi:hypothetical protein LJC45_01170 [Alistipes sp. OttesenSCG-928-B03]|nr:hypothetical protein [Alistipes sp. OttesenSCG-928-B03]
MLVKDIKSEMLAEIDYREIISNKTDTIEQRRTAIIKIASKHLDELLDEATRENFGSLPDGRYEECLDKIVKITDEVLGEVLEYTPLSKIEELISNHYNNN